MANFEWDLAGVIEICKSEGMQAALRDEAKKIASSANTAAHSYESRLHLGKKGFEYEPYKGSSKVLSKTAVGRVTSTKIGDICQKKFKVLSSYMH